MQRCVKGYVQQPHGLQHVGCNHLPRVCVAGVTSWPSHGKLLRKGAADEVALRKLKDQAHGLLALLSGERRRCAVGVVVAFDDVIPYICMYLVVDPPANPMVPEVCLTRPDRHAKSVVLPLPLRPNTTPSEPGGSCMQTLLSKGAGAPAGW